MRYTVKQLGKLAGVSARTLHFYDEIGLLHPAALGQNGYRYYEEQDLLRLQQILFYRELDFSLKEIAAIINNPGFDMRAALQSHRQALQKRVKRLERLIETIDCTIVNLQGAIKMKAKEYYEGFEYDEGKQAEYEEEIRQKYGSENLDISRQRWASYSTEQREQIKAEGGKTAEAMAASIPLGAGSPQAQAAVERWKAWIEFFYSCTDEILLGLGHLYVDDARYGSTLRKVHPNLPEFILEAFQVYYDKKNA